MVSVVAPTYNGGTHYHTCFESLCHLDYPPDLLEVLVIDDCSTDGTREYLQGRPLPAYLRLILPDANLGRAGARNLGLEQATGDVVIFLDGDMEVEPEFVHHHVAALAKPGREAIVGRVDPALWLPRSKLHRYLYRYPYRGARQFDAGAPIGFQYLLTGNLALSRQALTAAGSFDAEFTSYGGEDTLFAYRLAQGFPNGIFYDDRARSWHHQHHRMRPYLARLYGYGHHNLPRIVGAHPEIAAVLAADYAWPLPGRYFWRKRLIGRILFNPFTRMLAWLALVLLPYPASNYPVRFLFVASVVTGLRRHLREQRPHPHK